MKSNELLEAKLIEGEVRNKGLAPYERHNRTMLQ